MSTEERLAVADPKTKEWLAAYKRSWEFEDECDRLLRPTVDDLELVLIRMPSDGDRVSVAEFGAIHRMPYPGL